MPIPIRDSKLIQQKVEGLNNYELKELTNFIDYLHYKRANKDRRSSIIEELRNRDVKGIFGDPLAWQQSIRQNKPLEGRD
ncbi:MAG: hypothetical protein ACRER2_00395 [Methylococcales bacterium]